MNKYELEIIGNVDEKLRKFKEETYIDLSGILSQGGFG